MFCQNCGTQNGNNRFCVKCGTALVSGDVPKTPVSNDSVPYNPVPNNSVPNNSVPYNPVQSSRMMEVINISVAPNEEQETINLHQKMGWRLQNNQEINTSHVYGNSNAYTVVKENYVKLTFVRDKNMPYYNILKANYDKFCELKKQADTIEKNKKWFSPIWLIIPGVCAIIALIIVISLLHDGMGIFLGIFMSLAVFGLVFAIIGFINSIIKQNKKFPEVEALRNQMYQIANESERYL